MTTAEDVELDEEDRSRKPSKAVVGSHREEEEVFGKAIDPKIIRRIWAFVHPYRSKILLSVGAVLAFTFTQLAIPLLIRFAIDRGMAVGSTAAVLNWCVAGFLVVVLINYAASYLQEIVV